MKPEDLNEELRSLYNAIDTLACNVQEMIEDVYHDSEPTEEEENLKELCEEINNTVTTIQENYKII